MLHNNFPSGGSWLISEITIQSMIGVFEASAVHMNSDGTACTVIAGASYEQLVVARDIPCWMTSARHTESQPVIMMGFASFREQQEKELATHPTEQRLIQLVHITRYINEAMQSGEGFNDALFDCIKLYWEAWSEKWLARYNLAQKDAERIS